ncbi:MAG: hydrogenase maturation protease [Bacteroidia bacterium]|nr:MAG: hydrogenase maturation protease [Bacteroidia bacterium]
MENLEQGNAEILVMGVGNILLGDEGVGVHAIEYMKDKSFPVKVELLDGGTGGFHLLSLVNEYKKMVLIDAACDGHSPGTVRIIKPKYSSDFPRTLTTHDIGLKDLIETASALEKLPEIYLVVISINTSQPVRLTLSDEIASALPNVYNAVVSSIYRFIKQKSDPR